MSDAEREILKLAIEAYDGALERGGRFSIVAVGDRLYAEQVDRYSEDHSVGRDLLRIAIHDAIRKVDRQRAKLAPQATLFNDLDRPIPVGQAERIARRHMFLPDWAVHLAFVGDNAANVNAGAARENRRFTALSPYLSQGMNTEASVNAWQIDHPDGELP